jgi:hypothetical protein
MATAFEWFRSTATGKTGLYPARFASRPTFERIGHEEAACLDCLPPVETVDEDELIDLYEDEYGDDLETEEK